MRVGEIVGVRLGDADKISVGVIEFREVGLKVGLRNGARIVGNEEGNRLGKTDGGLVGLRLLPADGLKLKSGVKVGHFVGINEDGMKLGDKGKTGLAVGTGLGFEVIGANNEGARVVTIGELDGLLLGLSVGDIEGILVACVVGGLEGLPTTEAEGLTVG